MLVQENVCKGSGRTVQTTRLPPLWVESGCSRCGPPCRRFGATPAGGNPHERTSAHCRRAPQLDRSAFGQILPFRYAPMAFAQPIVFAHPKLTFHPQGLLDRDCLGLSDALASAA